MSGKLPLRWAAIGAAVIAVLAAGLRLAHAPAPVPTPPVAARPLPAARPELARCQALGAAGAEDPACLRAWAAERDRFLGVRAHSSQER